MIRIDLDERRANAAVHHDVRGLKSLSIYLKVGLFFAVSLASPPTTIVASALLFGFLHGLNGASILEVPHRFIAGLLFGWLRHRSGSLITSISGHARLNRQAVCV